MRRGTQRSKCSAQAPRRGRDGPKHRARKRLRGGRRTGRFRAGAAVGLTLFAAVLPARDEATEREAAALVEAALAAARDAASLEELGQARERFLEVPRRFPRSEHPRLRLRSRALVEAAAIARRTGVERQAAGELLRVLEREAVNEWTPRAHFELGDLLLMRGDWRNAARHLRLAREGATGGGGNVAGDALERMTLIHRLILRPLTGKERWLDSRNYLPARAGIERPRGVAAGAGGRLVVTEANRAAILDADEAPASARDLRGAVRPSHAASGAPGVITPDGVTGIEDPRTVSFGRMDGGDLDRIVAAHRDDFGNWTVLSRRSAEVLRYDPQGRPLDTLRVSALTQPIDLAVGRDGAIHVLDAGARSTPPSVLRFAADGRFEEAFRADWRRPVALAVDAFGNRYVLDAGTLQVLVYDPYATPLAALGPVMPGGQELRVPEDVAVDGQARIFIADSRLGQVLVLE